MKVLFATLVAGLISSCASRALVHSGVRTSIIPTAPAFPTATPQAGAGEDLRVDKKKQQKNVHNFFKAYGWLKKDDSIPEAKLPEAIRKIQGVLKVPQTGVYDTHIDTLMSKPRCGTIPPYNESEALEHGDFHTDFVMWGPKWDHTAITYRFVNYTADIPAEQQRSLMAAAFAEWTQHVPITITPAPASAARADIHIRFMSIGPTEDVYAFTNMIADGLSLSSGLINITFNDDWNWSDDRLFNYTAVHEIGHALGLSHSKVEPAIMFPWFVPEKRPLHPDDQAGIHGIYGWKNPRWSKIDGSTSSKSLVHIPAPASSMNNGLYQLRSSGQIAWYSPSNTWQTFDSSKDTTQIAGSNAFLYKRRTDGSIYKYTGSSSNNGWQAISAVSSSIADMTAAADQVYIRRKDSTIARWTGSSQSWTTLSQPSSLSSLQIAVNDDLTLWNLLSNGDLVRSDYPYGPDDWQIVDQNAANIAIAVGGDEFYKLQSDGSIVWLDLDEINWKTIENSGSKAVFAVGSYVYSRHGDGSVWRYTGTLLVWEQMDSRSDSVGMGGDVKGGVYEVVGGGDVWKLVS